MALTRDFKETIRARVKRDPGFRKALLREGIENFLSGDVETGKIILRDFINATVGFAKLSNVTHRSAKSLMRMLGPRGNPQAFCSRSLLICRKRKACASRSDPQARPCTRSGSPPREQNARLVSLCSFGWADSTAAFAQSKGRRGAAPKVNPPHGHPP
jgi:hypothetical protein